MIPRGREGKACWLRCNSISACHVLTMYLDAEVKDHVALCRVLLRNPGFHFPLVLLALTRHTVSRLGTVEVGRRNHPLPAIVDGESSSQAPPRAPASAPVRRQHRSSPCAARFASETPHRKTHRRGRARLGNGGVGAASADANSRVMAVLAQMGVEGALQLPNGSIRLPDGRVVGNFGLDGEGSGADASASTATGGGGGGGGGGGRAAYTSVILRGVPSNVRMMVQGLEGEVRGVKKKLKVSRGWL